MDNKKILAAIDKRMKIRISPSMYMVVGVIVLSVVLSGFIFYWLGSDAGYSKKAFEVRAQEDFQEQQELMSLSLEEVYETFLKYIMVKSMAWLPFIIGGLILGWILHGVFR